MATLKMILILSLLHQLTFDVSNAYKWYLNNPNAHEVQKRYEDLWNYGCCQNTIECQGDGPKYLGMDVFMRTWNNLLMIHQVNYMESKTFGLDYLPSEISIGRIGNNIDKHNHWATKLHEWCPHGDSKESRFITGFSVPDMNESFLVCDDIVLFIRLNDTQIITTKNRTEICPCNTTANCQGLHPIFCDGDSEKLMSIAAVPTKVKDSNPYLYGFYSSHSKHEITRTSRRYTVKVWRSTNYKTDPIHVTTSTGYLTEVDTFMEDEKGFYGMYFTNDGNACPFYRKYSEDTQIQQQSNLSFEYLTTPRQPCLSFQIFIGCPQPWCFSNRIDASFTVEDRAGKHSYIAFAVGNFMWKVNDTELPLKLPRVEEANKPIFKKGTDVNSHNLNPCRDFLADAEMISCAVPNIGAAFAWKKHQWSIFYYSTSLKTIIYSEAWSQSPVPLKKTNMLKPDSPETNFWYDAFWPNVKENFTYGFIGQKYEKFNSTNSTDMNTPKFLNVTGHLNEFHIEAPLLDAVVNRENKGYFFYNNFYYEVPEDNWRNKASQTKIFAMQTFFDIRKECYANNQEAYEALVSRFIPLNSAKGQTVTGEVILNTPSNTQNTQENSRASEIPTEAPKSLMFIVYILVFGIFIVIGVVIALFTFKTIAPHKGTKQRITKVQKSETVSSGSPSIKSSPKTPSRGGSKQTN